jgi:hypothetical protein
MLDPTIKEITNCVTCDVINRLYNVLRLSVPTYTVARNMCTSIKTSMPFHPPISTKLINSRHHYVHVVHRKTNTVHWVSSSIYFLCSPYMFRHLRAILRERLCPCESLKTRQLSMVSGSCLSCLVFTYSQGQRRSLRMARRCRNM